MLVKVCDTVFCVTEAGNVGVPPIVYVPASVPENVGLETVGDVSVLFVSVWESVSPTGWEDKLRRVLRLMF